jgi:Caspase domain/VHL beta domain
LDFLMRVFGTIVFAIWSTGLFSQPVFAERRVALVVGNGAYQNVPVLPNPPNDAADVALAFKRLGFDTALVVDADKNAMDEATIRFSRAARTADVAVFYYSGHAMQFAGVNYLAPIDAKLRDEADLRRMTRVDDILSDLQQAKNLRILVLDSCRDNPLMAELKRSMGRTRSANVGDGLSKMDSPNGTIISYATQSGRTAEDGTGRNSPYTMAFLKHIEDKDNVSAVFHRISGEVYSTSGGSQVPELSLSFFGELYLNGKLQVTIAPQKNDLCSSASDHWKSALSIDTPDAYEDHMARYPGCSYAGLARAKVAALKVRDQKEKQDAELSFWNSVKDSKSQLDFQDYLRRFPAGSFTASAQQRLEALKQASLGETASKSQSDVSVSTGEYPCSAERSLKSTRADTSVNITFQNRSTNPISTYWLDYSGNRKLYQRLAGGASYTQQTFVTHPWVLVDDDGRCRKIILPSTAMKVVTNP